MRQYALLAVFGLALACALPAEAQDQPLTRNDPTQALPPPPEDSEDLEQAPRADAPAGEESTGIRLTGARFVGARAVSEDQLRPAWQAYVGRDVSVSDLRAIARSAEKIYARAGYPFVAIVVQPQEIEDGIVDFTVVEGRISDLTVLGSDPVARRQAAGAFQPLLDREPLPGDEMQRAYELARTLPGLSVAGALRRGSKPGGMDLVVQTRRRSWRAYVNVNNLYSDPVGPWGALVGADLFGASLYGDVTSVQLYSTFETDEQQVLRLSHSRRVNRLGTSVSASWLWAEANPQGVVAPLDLATDVSAGRIEVAHPLALRGAFNLHFAGAVEYSDQTTDVFNSIALTEDRTRIASARLFGDWKGERHLSRFVVELRKGLDILDASRPGDPLNSRPEGDPQAALVRGSADIEYQVLPRWRLYGRFEGQFTDAPLLAPEEYSAGNLSVGRGYDPGSALGDSAAAFVAEARWGPYPFPNTPVRFAPFVFFDSVNYWNEDTTGVQERWIASAGVGVRFDMPGRGRLDVTWAEPLRPPLGAGEEEPSGRFLINFTATWDDLAEGLYQRARQGVGR